MRNLVCGVLCGLAGLLLAACGQPGGGGGASHAGWGTDLTAALAEAKASGKPVLIDFGAEW